jgi:hypothetical protein
MIVLLNSRRHIVSLYEIQEYALANGCAVIIDGDHLIGDIVIELSFAELDPIPVQSVSLVGLVAY